MPVDREPRWPLVVLLLGIACALAPVFRNGLVYDDTQLIAQSAFIHDARNLPALFSHPSMVAFNIYSGRANAVDTFRPLTIASFMWDAALAGKSPWSYHLTNLLLHLVCVALVWRMARALLPEQQRAFAYLVAAWFGLAPLQAEAHVWISGRYDLLSSAFALGAILTWRASRAVPRERRARALEALVAALFLLALLGKEVPLLVLPALWLWPEREPGEHSALVKLWRRALALWPFCVAIAAYLGLRLHALQGMRTHRDESQLLLALSHLPLLLAEGLMQALSPSKIYLRVLSEEYAKIGTWQIVLATSLVLVVALLALRSWRRFPLAAWGLLWFASLLAPACIVTTLHWPGFGRYLYFASVGLFVALASLAAEIWSQLPRLRRTLVLGGACYAVLLLWTLERYIATYRSPETLYVNVIEQRPDLASGYGLLAAYYASELRNLPQVATLYQLASARSPDKFEYAKGLADTLFMLGQREQMLRVAEAAERRMGADPEWELLKARALVERDSALTVTHLLRCLQLSPGEPRCVAALRGLADDPHYRELLAQKLAHAGTDPRLAPVAELLQRDK
jgi:hypothetical protein